MVMEATKSHNLLSANCKCWEALGVIQPKSKSLRTMEAYGFTPSPCGRLEKGVKEGRGAAVLSPRV